LRGLEGRLFLNYLTKAKRGFEADRILLCMTTNMKIDYQSEFKKKLKENISLVRGEIDSDQTKEKISNHAQKFDRTSEEIRDEILRNDLFAEFFAKDPAKQNIFEKTAANYLKQIPSIKNFKNLPNGAKVFVSDGSIVDKRQNDSIKSVDFYFETEGKKFYCTHKYTGTGDGSAQKEQYIDARNFMSECYKGKDPNVYFLTILDGPYYEKKPYRETLNKEFQTTNCYCLSIEEVEGFINKVR
jgi:predicted phosphodiesterase